MTVDQIIDLLRAQADPDKIAYKEAKFGIVSHNALGIYQAELNEIAKKVPKDDVIALALFDSHIYEARLLCSKIFDPKNLTEALMDKWTETFDNWEICDSFCMGLFAKSKFAVPKAIEWSNRVETFVKRAGFTTMAAYCTADKVSPNETFRQFLPLIKRACTDERLYVKKAVNWALRNIGKRNSDLNLEAISVAEDILTIQDKTAQWIAKHALKELTSQKVRMSDYPRDVYRRKSES
ncbi:MAG: DNA alkylation repair protein [Bacteroidota bacterium]